MALNRKEINLRNKKRFKNWLLSYKKKQKCYLCGYKEHTKILEFHHIIRQYRNKKNGINKGLMTGNSIKKALEVMKGTIMLCPTCHRLVHYDDIKNKKKSENKKLDDFHETR